MNLTLMEDIMEAFHLTKRTVEGLPNLPDQLQNGMLPILSALRRIQDNEGKARVTDISKYLKISSPYVVRIVGLCEKQGFLTKWKDDTDKRVVNIRLTDKGNQVLEKTMDAFHTRLCEKFSQIPDEEWKILINLLNKSYFMVGEVCAELHNQLPDWK